VPAAQHLEAVGTAHLRLATTRNKMAGTDKNTRNTLRTQHRRSNMNLTIRWTLFLRQIRGTKHRKSLLCINSSRRDRSNRNTRSNTGRLREATEEFIVSFNEVKNSLPQNTNTRSWSVGRLTM